MSRDSVPPLPRIEPSDLRDHGTPERIDRVWERLERSVALSSVGTAEAPKRAPRDRGRYALAAVAIAAGFALGIGVSSWWSGDERDDGGVVIAEADGEQLADVFAAGTAQRQYPLPGGGMLRLEPGTIVDTVARSDGSLTLRLVRGEATLITSFSGTSGQVTSSRVALLVGNAELTPAGSLRVRHDGDTAMVQVIDGSASVSAPDAERGRRDMVLRPDDSETTVPVRVITASVDDHAQQPPPRDDDDEPIDGVDAAPVDEALPGPVGPSEPIVTLVQPEPWMQACKGGDDEKAARLLKASGGSLDGVADAELLQCVATGQELLKDDDDAIASYERIVNGTGTMKNKAVAARSLAALYNKQGKTLQANKYAAIAKDALKGDLDSAEALCNKIQLDDEAGNAQSVLENGNRYLRSFRDGPCAARARELMQKHRAGPEPEPEEPEEDSDDSAEPDDKKESKKG